jgi:putative sigma-54 modulation protein
MAVAIDNAVEKIERQLKKHKEKIREHKNVSPRVAEELEGAEAEFPSSKISDFHRVVLFPLSLDDALQYMEEKKKRFFLFRDAASQRVCLLYRNDSGGFGLVETNA